MERTFRHVADDKKVSFNISIDPNVPPSISTDAQRLEQVLKNLLSNAFKFTERGYVNLRIAPATEGWSEEVVSLSRADSVLAFSVTDTGIGIAADKQTTIFEPFLQADGSTSRRYGGTGLGLAISRELARVLGGEIRIESREGRGSTFTLFLPQNYSGAPGERRILAPHFETGEISSNGETPADEPPEFAVADDRNIVAYGEKVILIVEDDRDFANWLLDFTHDKGFKAIVTSRGKSALELVEEHTPVAVLLDITLPDITGWKVLDRLKSDLRTRHIPVFIISANEEPDNALKQGALRFLTKPVDPSEVDEIFAKIRQMGEAEAKKLLVIEDDENQRNSIRGLIGNGTAQITDAATAADALNAIERERFDCVVLDLLLPDMSGFELPKCISIVFDIETGFLTAIEAEVGHPSNPREVIRTIIFGRIEGIEAPINAFRPCFTNELVGKALYWRNTLDGPMRMKYIFCSPNYYTYAMSFGEDKYWMSTNPSEYVKVKEGLYLMSVVEVRQAGFELNMLMNLDIMRDVQSGFGIGTDGPTENPDKVEAFLRMGRYGSYSTMETIYDD
jgi:CheY-like chemotaxis protein